MAQMPPEPDISVLATPTTAAVSGEKPLLEIEDLCVEFASDDGPVVAVDGVSYDVAPGETVGVVGESGSGKSVTAMSVLGLIRAPGRVSRGGIRFRGRDLRTMNAKELRSLRGGAIAMIFQDPSAALNPVVTVGTQIVEALRLHQRNLSEAAARRRVVELLASVGVPAPEERARQYPHEFSGGMRQRAMIAMALANDPELLIADEPTTALDVTIQAQVLKLLRAAQRATGAATILITHDLGVIAELADRVVVMYAGRVMEQADVHTLFHEARHPYTLGLMTSMPQLGEERLRPIPGSPPDMRQPIEGCAFHPRCPLARERCRTERPKAIQVGVGHTTACHYHEELVGVDGRELFAAVSGAIEPAPLTADAVKSGREERG
jgi:oligopeptide/dipeptide ABC transporter ATP-binding protein